MILIFNKPFNVLCQFSDSAGRQTLKDYIQIKNLYPAGRLDLDSEGLLLLTDNGVLQHLISHPDNKLDKTYWVQVEGTPNESALSQLEQGVILKDGKTKPAKVAPIEEPQIWARNPPIRYRANIPTSWLQLSIREGKNRQVRRMTAAVGHPTLRLIRAAIGPILLDDLVLGEYREIPLDSLLQDPNLPVSWRKMLVNENTISKPIKKKTAWRKKPTRRKHHQS